MEARIIQRKCAFAAIVAATIAGGTTPAAANPILSGYGGPGQGSQVILGSALLNGSGGGGGQARGPQPSASGGSVQSIAAALSAPVPTDTASRHPGRSATGRRSARAQPARSVGRAPPQHVRGGASGVYSVSRHAAQPFLGISRRDLIGIFVAVGALILVGLLTRRLARIDAEARPPKAMERTHRTIG